MLRDKFGARLVGLGLAVNLVAAIDDSRFSVRWMVGADGLPSVSAH